MKEIQLTQDKVALVDDSDYEWLNQKKWCAKKFRSTWYAIRRSHSLSGKVVTMYMHRAILGLDFGDPRQGDHINHEGLDNRRENLRIVTHQENLWNQRNAKGYKRDKNSGKYCAKLQVNEKTVSLGNWNTPEEARAAYLSGKDTYHRIKPQLSIAIEAREKFDIKVLE